MSTIQMRGSPTTPTAVREIAQHTGQPMQVVLEKAVEEYRTKLFFEQVSAAYARLQENPSEWEEELAARREWDATLLDGLSSD